MYNPFIFITFATSARACDKIAKIILYGPYLESPSAENYLECKNVIELFAKNFMPVHVCFNKVRNIKKFEKDVKLVKYLEKPLDAESSSNQCSRYGESTFYDGESSNNTCLIRKKLNMFSKKYTTLDTKYDTLNNDILKDIEKIKRITNLIYYKGMLDDEIIDSGINMGFTFVTSDFRVDNSTFIDEIIRHEKLSVSKITIAINTHIELVDTKRLIEFIRNCGYIVIVEPSDNNDEPRVSNRSFINRFKDSCALD